MPKRRFGVLPSISQNEHSLKNAFFVYTVGKQYTHSTDNIDNRGEVNAIHLDDVDVTRLDPKYCITFNNRVHVSDAVLCSEDTPEEAISHTKQKGRWHHRTAVFQQLNA